MTGATRRRRLKVWLPTLATVALLAPLAYLWQDSLVPETFSVHDMGTADYGGGPVGGHGGGHGSGGSAVSLDSLTADPKRPADVSVELVTEAATLDIGGRPSRVSR